METRPKAEQLKQINNYIVSWNQIFPSMADWNPIETRKTLHCLIAFHFFFLFFFFDGKNEMGPQSIHRNQNV